MDKDKRVFYSICNKCDLNNEKMKTMELEIGGKFFEIEEDAANLIIMIAKERDELKDFAIWMTSCGYDFCQHEYFVEKKDELLKSDGEVKVTEVVRNEGVNMGESKVKAINIVIDVLSNGDHLFVDVETDDGKCINAWKWIKRDDGLWFIRIDHLPVEGKENASSN
jgi:hypothetical protein